MRAVDHDISRVLQDEREALAVSMLAAGAGAPTLCEGWTVLDLAAHLVVRERRPDAAAGLVLRPLAGRLDRLMAAEATRGLPAVVARLRAGPPPWSPFAVPAIDRLGNLAELIVHHEDVRRAGGAPPREDVATLDEVVWQTLPRTTRFPLARSAVPVVAVHPDGRRHVLRRGPQPVELTGGPVELLLLAFGRRSVAQVDVDGPSLSVTRFEGAPRRV